MPRNYKSEYQNYHGKPDQIKKRAQRVMARRAMKKKLGAAIDGKDIDHKVPFAKGGTNNHSNLRVRDVSKNRSFKRDHKSRMK